MKMNRQFHKGDGHRITTLDVDQMKFSRDELLNAQVWLQEVMLGDTQDAAHARALYSFSTAVATAILKQPSHPAHSGDLNISNTRLPTNPSTLSNNQPTTDWTNIMDDLTQKARELAEFLGGIASLLLDDAAQGCREGWYTLELALKAQSETDRFVDWYLKDD